jgi:uncharacterized protein (TIGR03067 family)
MHEGPAGFYRRCKLRAEGKEGTMPYTDADVAELLRALQGRWRPVYQEVDGQMVSPAVTAATMLELQGNDFRVEKDGTVAYDGTFTFDPLASPMRVVLIYKTSSNPLLLGGPRLGVFQVEADTFKWCIGAVGHSAPKELNTYAGSESVLSVYQRDPGRAPAAAAGVAGGGQIHFSPAW